MNMTKLNDGAYYHCFLRDNATSVCEEDNYFVFERVFNDGAKRYKTIPIIARCKDGKLYDLITGKRIAFVKREEDTSHKTPGKSLVSYCAKEVNKVFVANSLKALDEQDLEEYTNAIKTTSEISHLRYEEEVAKMKAQEEAAEEYIKRFTASRRSFINE